jgi:hypothetical protein
MVLDGKKHSSPAPGRYDLPGSLKSARFTFGKALRGQGFLALAQKKSEHSPPPNTYNPNHTLAEPAKYSNIRIGKGLEYYRK